MKIVYETGFFIDVKNLFSAPLKVRAVFHIIFVSKIGCQKMLSTICSMKFLSSDVVLCLYKSNIWSDREKYYYHVWAFAPIAT